MVDRTRRNELMIAVTTALYTNWLICIAVKFNAQSLTIGSTLFYFSLPVLIFYFREAFKSFEEQVWLGFLPLQIFLGLIHFVLVLMGLVTDGIFQENQVFTVIGGALWILMSQQIRRVD